MEKAAPKTGKESLPLNDGTMPRKAIGRESAGKSAPIKINPDRAKPNTGIGSGRTMPRAPREPEMDRTRLSQ